MSKTRVSIYTCETCGHDEPKWLGRCPSCGEWNTFKVIQVDRSQKKSKLSQNPNSPVLLSHVDATPPERHPTGIMELDRVLGGGLAPGTTVLLGGEPGIGKSTLLLQVAATLPGVGLYVSGEELTSQIKTRADRLKLDQDSLEVLNETDLGALMNVLNHHVPAYLVVDSIQTLVSSDAGTIPGTLNQLKMTSHRLAAWGKEHRVPVFFIAHVTKEGAIAGPKVIEHLVDTVLYFDHNSSDIRILRATKNRMGAIDEVGLFRMEATGLEPITDPSGLFLVHRKANPPLGSAVAAVYEGSRILLVEIQALVVPSKGAGGRVYSDRVEAARVSRIAAVLERHAGLKLSDQDIYVNVAGGLRINDTGAELAVALAVASALIGKPLPPNFAIFGEITLAGEIRDVPHLHRRIKTSVDSGLTNWLTSGDGNIPDTLPGKGITTSLIHEAVNLSLRRDV